VLSDDGAAWSNRQLVYRPSRCPHTLSTPLHSSSTTAMLLPFLAALQLSTLTLAAPAQLPFAAHTLPALSSFGLSPAHLSSLEVHIASLPERRLVQLSESSAPIEISEGEKALLVLQSIRFADVTDEDRFLTVQAKRASPPTRECGWS
jgi:hypothetical protein